MFILNMPTDDSLVLVDYLTKKYLESKGFCPVSRKKGKWAFKRTDELLNILSSRKGGNQDV